MRRAIWLTMLVGLSACGAASAQTARAPEALPADFASRAYDQVKALSALGVRAAGTHGEQAAVDYVRQQFAQAGLQVSEERFEFEAFAMEKAVLHLGDRAFTPTRVLLDPYAGKGELTAQAVWVHPTSGADLQQLDGAGKIIITDAPQGLWGLGLVRPLAVVCVEAKDADAIRALDGAQARLEVIGRVRRVHSANIIGRLSPEHATDKEIVISAHLDSVGGPGANDNASGVATLLALAEQLSRERATLTSPVRFVAFGSEEMGMQGALAFIERHARELPDLRMLINLDTIGAGGAVLFNVLQAPQAGPGRVPAQLRRQFAGEQWGLLDPALLTFLAGDYPSPGWLKDTVSASSEEMGVPVQFVNSIGSDNVAFGATGVPIVAFVVDGAGDEEHSARDTADLVHPDSLAKVGAVVAAIVRRPSPSP